MIAITEKPMLMKGELVVQTLDGVKRVTRRLMRIKRSSDCPPELPDDQLHKEILEWRFQDGQWFGLHEWRTLAVATCPFGEAGDRLWVRETWHANESFDDLSPAKIGTASIDAGYQVSPKHPACGIWYPADDSHRQWADGKETRGKTRTSIHMPRWACRLTLEVESISIERIQSITERQIRLEGIESRPQFIETWNALNADRGGSWWANPWVWVVGYKISEVLQ